MVHEELLPALVKPDLSLTMLVFQLGGRSGDLGFANRWGRRSNGRLGRVDRVTVKIGDRLHLCGDALRL